MESESERSASILLPGEGSPASASGVLDDPNGDLLSVTSFRKSGQMQLIFSLLQFAHCGLVSLHCNNTMLTPEIRM